MRETPGLIPNPEAKPHSADGTAHGSVWESRTPPNTPLAQSFWVWVQGDSAPKTVWFWGHTCIPTRFGVLWLVGWLVGSCVLWWGLVVGSLRGRPQHPHARWVEQRVMQPRYEPEPCSPAQSSSSTASSAQTPPLRPLPSQPES